jgi:hypothetical protein
MSDGSTDLATLTEAMLAAAKAAGADAADAIAVDGTSLSVDVLNGQLEQAERAEGVEIGLRVMVGQRQASVSASDTRPDTLREMAERAVGMATACARGPDRGPRRSRHAEPGSRCRCPRPRRSLRRPHAPRAGGRSAAGRGGGARRQGHLAGAIRQRRVLAAAHTPGGKQRLFRWIRAQQPRPCPAWPSPARGWGWSGTISATAAPMPPT